MHKTSFGKSEDRPAFFPMQNSTLFLSSTKRIFEADNSPNPADIQELSDTLDSLPETDDNKQQSLTILVNFLLKNKQTNPTTLPLLVLIKKLGRSTLLQDHDLDKNKILALIHYAQHSLKQNSLKDQNLLDILSEILTIFANQILLEPTTSNIFIQADGISIISASLTAEFNSSIIYFLCARILFLVLHNGLDPIEVVEGLHIPDLLSSAVTKLVNPSNAVEIQNHSQINTAMATSEIYKALYIIFMLYEKTTRIEDITQKPSIQSHFGYIIAPEKYQYFKRTLETALSFLTDKSNIDKHPKSCISAIQVLFLFPIAPIDEILQAWLSKNDGFALIDSLVSVLENQLKNHNFDKLKSLNPITIQEQAEDFPIVCVLGRMCLADEASRNHLYDCIFKGRDFSKLPEEGDSIRAKLTKIVGSPMQSEFSLAVGDFLYVLCNSSTSLFTQNLGFGNTAGYLNARSLLISEINVDVNLPAQPSFLANPITGTDENYNREIEKELETMTDEEKEREAERLFVLFDKLNRTGIIKVQPQFGNPNNEK
ncbi:hypothetical protein BB559_000034 [Furculomyces boomerangus]|uniref:Uncharacterized protein n=2 Tax=Harpellales TaxID=61421 RepID=A0A2T9Z6J1_9FUNG|nr:hypothetical protein BB559_000034 [Furculomyces boomerangus]PWA01377.1 hypothetical protein BB558_002532 [Smittium angustum]